MKKLLVILLTLLMIAALPLAVMADEPVTDVAEEETFRCTCENCIPEETEEVVEDGPKTQFGFFPKTLAETLPVMGMGMLGIFLVIGVIVLAVLVLSKIGKPEED